MVKNTLDKIYSYEPPLTCLTCYDYLTARVMDEVPELDMILVGDSLGNVELGYDSTIPVTMDDMVHHTAAVGRAVENTFLVADFPFLEAALSQEEAVKSVRRLMQEGGAQAIKVEGGGRNFSLVEHLTAHDVPVIGHLGLTPQSKEAFGGFKIQAKTEADIEKIGKESLGLQEAGAVAIVLEGIPAEVAKELTDLLKIPTIGIGAGKECDGQVLVWQDMMGMTGKNTPTFVRKWGDMRKHLREGVTSYCQAVKDAEFPDETESFSLPDSVNQKQLRSLLSD